MNENESSCSRKGLHDINDEFFMLAERAKWLSAHAHFQLLPVLPASATDAVTATESERGLHCQFVQTNGAFSEIIAQQFQLRADIGKNFADHDIVRVCLLGHVVDKPFGAGVFMVAEAHRVW
jgi:hypothetical protein